MEASAKLRKIHVSPRKADLVAKLIRGMNVDKALQTLQFTQKGVAPDIAKLLKCATANYQSSEGQGDTQPEDLYIKEMHVGSAGMLKRVQPAPRGVAHRIRKRMSHITVVVDREPPKEVKPKKATATKKSIKKETAAKKGATKATPPKEDVKKETKKQSAQTTPKT